MAPQAYPNVYLEGVEVPEDTGEEPNQVWHQAVLGVYVGQCEQRILGSRRKRYNAASGTHMQPSQSRLSLPDGILCSIAQNVRNRRMPNGTYGGVRGRETKEIGGKLQESFVFLLLDFLSKSSIFAGEETEKVYDTDCTYSSQWRGLLPFYSCREDGVELPNQ